MASSAALARTSCFEITGVFQAQSSAGMGDIVAFGVVSGTVGSALQAQELFVGSFLPDVSLAMPDNCTNCTIPVPAGATDPPFPPIWPYNSGDIYGRQVAGMNLLMVRGDNFSFGGHALQTNVNTNTTSDLDLTGVTLRCTAKWNYDDLDAAAVFQLVSPTNIDITDPAGGLFTVNIVPANTNGLPTHETTLYYDVQMVAADSKVYTLLRGELTVVPDVTLTT